MKFIFKPHKRDYYMAFSVVEETAKRNPSCFLMGPLLQVGSLFQLFICSFSIWKNDENALVLVEKTYLVRNIVYEGSFVDEVPHSGKQ